MKKVIAMALATVMMLSTTAFAADDFYGIKPDAGITVGAKTDKLGLNVNVANPVEDAYYGVLLVQGTELPDVDTDILYIDQKTADANGVSFDVLPLTPATGDVKLYVSTNASNTLLTAAMKYGTEAPANDYITSADTTKGTITVDIEKVEHSSMGDAVGNKLVQLVLDTKAYPAAGTEKAGYIVKAVKADGSAIENSTVFYSAERKKYVAVIPEATTDYKFEVLAAGTEGATANDVIAKYGNMNEDESGKINSQDLLTFRKYVKGTSKPTVKGALLADVSADGKINSTDLLTFRKAVKGSDYTFKITEK